MTWEEMRRLAEVGSQIIDGEFSGYHESRLRLRLEAIDSGCWMVTSDDSQVLASVRRRDNVGSGTSFVSDLIHAHRR